MILSFDLPLARSLRYAALAGWCQARLLFKRKQSSNRVKATLYLLTQRLTNMEITNLVPLIESLDDNIDDLEEALEPLLKSALIDTAGKLPLLDKAQLYVLVTYAIESVLFCVSARAFNTLNADRYSLPPTKWYQLQRTPCLSRVDSGQTILREDQGCGVGGNQTECDTG